MYNTYQQSIVDINYRLVLFRDVHRAPPCIALHRARQNYVSPQWCEKVTNKRLKVVLATQTTILLTDQIAAPIVRQYWAPYQLQSRIIRFPPEMSCHMHTQASHIDGFYNHIQYN